jgi:hypothetical protein
MIRIAREAERETVAINRGRLTTILEGALIRVLLVGGGRIRVVPTLKEILARVGFPLTTTTIW